MSVTFQNHVNGIIEERNFLTLNKVLAESKIEAKFATVCISHPAYIGTAEIGDIWWRVTSSLSLLSDISILEKAQRFSSVEKLRGFLETYKPNNIFSLFCETFFGVGRNEYYIRHCSSSISLFEYFPNSEKIFKHPTQRKFEYALPEQMRQLVRAIERNSFTVTEPFPELVYPNIQSFYSSLLRSYRFDLILESLVDVEITSRGFLSTISHKKYSGTIRIKTLWKQTSNRFSAAKYEPIQTRALGFQIRLSLDQLGGINKEPFSYYSTFEQFEDEEAFRDIFKSPSQIPIHTAGKIFASFTQMNQLVAASKKGRAHVSDSSIDVYIPNTSPSQPNQTFNDRFSHSQSNSVSSPIGSDCLVRAPDGLLVRQIDLPKHQNRGISYPPSQSIKLAQPQIWQQRAYQPLSQPQRKPLPPPRSPIHYQNTPHPFRHHPAHHTNNIHRNPYKR